MIQKLDCSLRLLAPALLMYGGLSCIEPAHAQDDALVAKGAYVARAADCIACHTALHGAPYAGRLAIKSPIGTIYSTNITPDPAYGIGTYTLDEFSEAVRHGIRRDGSTLYPAMPYPAFSNMTDDDIAALYAFFMHGVKPVAQANREADIRWPFSMRWPLAIWRALFAPPPKPYQPVLGTDPVIARGEYLVIGAGHCGACHTPRGFAMQEKANDASDGDVFLAGGAPIDHWIAPSLRNDPVLGIGKWSEDDLYQFLKSGRIDHAAVFGGMADVVAWSTQYMTDGDLHAIAKYLKSLPSARVVQADYAYDPATAKKLDAAQTPSDPGSVVYLKQCAICHRNDGAGVERMFPPLAGNPIVVTDNPESLINVVVHGGVLPPTNWAPSAVEMPAFGNQLSDQEIADVVNMIRTSWGNRATANVTPSDVAKLRHIENGSNAGWSSETGKGWQIFRPQPYGYGWTFSPQTHTGVDTAQ